MKSFELYIQLIETALIKIKTAESMPSKTGYITNASPQNPRFDVSSRT